MILFPPCKINLGLAVKNKREDGYHNLETVMFQLPWCDILEVVKSEKFSFKSTGLLIAGDENNNLCIKTFNLIKQHYNISNVTINLHKIIPMGAGLGGGSADGTYTLIALNELFNLKLDANKLREYALTLGSDCPLFVENFTQFAEGRGEILTPIDLNLNGYYIHLINIGIHVSTKEAFENIKFNNDQINISELIQTPVNQWKLLLKNDFEETVFKLYPKLLNLKNNMYQNNALYASMTGSGSTIFGIYSNKPNFLFNTNTEGILEKIIQLK